MSKETDDFAERPVARVLDTRGVQCPLPVLKARKALKEIEAGQVLSVLATDPMAAIDIPHFCNEAGHDFLGQICVDDTVTDYRLAKG
ncbi:sulfurtransferase TusA family protein [Coralliovum pocilloporae]|uniref:sulfurtransferase TusA family protein n=1 Tax=Coralliovum pocilloporae TaxID=3066369 RepID=UPI003307BBCB